MLDPELADRIAAGKVLAARSEPYLAAGLQTLSVRAARGCGVAAADRFWRLYVDPDVAGDWSAAQWAAVLRGEARRLLLGHAERADRTVDAADPDEPRRFALASDATVVSDTERSGPADWPAAVRRVDEFPGGRPGMAVEDVYELLAVQNVELPAGGDGHGSAADGRPRPWEQPDAPEDASSLSATHADLLRRQIAERVAEHAASGAASSPLLEQWAAALTRPRVDWRRTLDSHVRAATARAAGRRDYTFTRPSRRQAPAGAAGRAILPGMDAPAPARVVVIRDTSGSMTTGRRNLIDEATGEISGMLNARARVTLIDTDSDAHQPVRATSTNVQQAAGGGSTDMGAGLTAAGRLRPRPQLAVVLTDGETPWPQRNPLRGVPVLICLLGPDAARQLDRVPDWASAIVIDTATG